MPGSNFNLKYQSFIPVKHIKKAQVIFKQKKFSGAVKGDSLKIAERP